MTLRPEVMICLPMVLRIWGLIWCVPFVFGGGAMLSHGNVFGVLFMAMSVFIASIFRQRVCTEGDTLHVRNFFVDHLYDRSEVASFARLDPIHRRTAAGPSLLGGKLVATLKDSRMLVLYATQRGAFGRAELETMRSELNGWLNNGSSQP